MPLTRPAALVLLAGLSLSHPAYAGPAASGGGKTVPLTAGGELSLRLPASWREFRRVDDPRGFTTVELRSAGVGDFSLQVSAGRVQQRRSPRGWVERASREIAPQSIERTLAIESLCGSGDT